MLVVSSFLTYAGGRPVLARAFYGWRDRCRLRELRHASLASRVLRRRLLHAARQRLWRWRLSQHLRCWCEATRLLSWGRLRLLRAVRNHTPFFCAICILQYTINAIVITLPRQARDECRRRLREKRRGFLLQVDRLSMLRMHWAMAVRT